jgi:hypothetical protein
MLPDCWRDIVSRLLGTGTDTSLQIFVVIASATVALAANTVPPAIEQPGTQPTEVNNFASNCESCHAGTSNPAFEPSFGWHGGMMAHAMRDGLFWATLAVAEQDFLPNADPVQRGGAGDLCLRCHGPGGWLGGVSEPTDGSLYANNDARGVECEFCHLLVDPDQALTVPGTVEVQNSPYLAYDSVTGDGYYGSGQYVINGNGTRLGPYAEADANHPHLQSNFHRRGEICGTCHDVSNPAVGDLAHNNGAQIAPPEGSSGDPASPVQDKVQFLNPPFAYGMVERTFSEWKASALDEWPVNDFASLPAELRVAGGALDIAYHRAYDARLNADYVDGTQRTFTCQTCHMAASTGVGCNKNNVSTRDDLPRHDQTGGGYWMPDVVVFQGERDTLRLGDDLTQDQIDAMEAGKQRAGGHLASAASLVVTPGEDDVVVRVTNLTAHKLISGYPEGRRMWINLVWTDDSGAVVHENGAYGPIGRTVDDLDAVPHEVETIIDPGTTVVYEARAGLDQQWAQQLIDLGYDPELALDYDRSTGLAIHTLGELADSPAGTAFHSFHFVLNNTIITDTRIPPFGFDRDEAANRNALPVPTSLYGNPASGEVYEHWDETSFPIPQGATRVTVKLLYQQTSWEYIQFLWLANDRASSFLGDEGVNMLDAWLNTGMSAPFEMDAVTVQLDGSTIIFTDGFENGDTCSWSEATGGCV